MEKVGYCDMDKGTVNLETRVFTSGRNGMRLRHLIQSVVLILKNRRTMGVLMRAQMSEQTPTSTSILPLRLYTLQLEHHGRTSICEPTPLYRTEDVT